MYKDGYVINRLDFIGPSITSRSAQSGSMNDRHIAALKIKKFPSMEEKLARLKENIIFAKAEAFDHIQTQFERNIQVTKEDVFATLKPIQGLFKGLKHPTSEGKMPIIDDLSYQDKEFLFIFTELYYRLKPVDSIILYDEPDHTKWANSNLLQEIGANNQILLTSYPTKGVSFRHSGTFTIENYLNN
jgi:hypothetical protein